MTTTQQSDTNDGTAAVARVVGTRHPGAMLAGSVVPALIGLAVLVFARPFGVALLLFGIMALLASVMAFGAIWSRQHLPQTRQALDARRRERDESLLRHPVLWLALAPPFVALRAAVIVHGDHPHSAWGWVLGAAGGFLMGLAIVGGFVEAARRRRARGDRGYDPSR